MRCFLFLFLLGAKIPKNVETLTIDEKIASAAKSGKDLAFYHPADKGKPPVVKFQLDMLFTEDQWKEIQRLKKMPAPGQRYKRKAVRVVSRWTNGVIPYTITRGIFTTNELQEISKAMQEWERYTCIQFRQASRNDQNFIRFVDGNGCSSYVGMINRPQEIELAWGCREKGVIVHELGHAVGFVHEQSRPDRDRYVIILKENIPSHLYNQFDKMDKSMIQRFGIPYDYDSVMHYGAKEFSINGGDTIRTKDPRYQTTIGNKNGLSFLDMKMANLMYECSKRAGCNRKIRCPGEGFVDKNCNCMCPTGRIYRPVAECRGTTARPGPG